MCIALLNKVVYPNIYSYNFILKFCIYQTLQLSPFIQIDLIDLKTTLHTYITVNCFNLKIFTLEIHIEMDDGFNVNRKHFIDASLILHLNVLRICIMRLKSLEMRVFTRIKNASVLFALNYFKVFLTFKQTLLFVFMYCVLLAHIQTSLYE